ncbi:MAG: laccase domain-containing protein, partial [Acidimicrobiales bacterium]|nr:laccase domain-containing protein [Acidimicrobiales bacterium]
MPPAAAASLVRWDDGTRFGVDVAVTTRHGGVSPPPYATLNLGLHVGDEPANVAANRARAATAFGVDLGSMVFARQVHGARAVQVGPADRGRGVATEDDAIPDA